MRSDDKIYFLKRAKEERERAASCEDNCVALAHQKMADAYEKRLSGAPVAKPAGTAAQIVKSV
ncbi:hypothetical protein NYR55_04160 [Sphingomonas sp. BGYR3]|uniref:hypothetical protein n=1 Tax=Sphingomonas sp. BGYR3 TaxID=2975483 RepID=UPI0021A38DA2|nr:hypothetical protein [Sphingomonas sp. BGYR3]MDG5487814.1 hypothetical protein [Sphingomonas sp. BGYR3]